MTTELEAFKRFALYFIDGYHRNCRFTHRRFVCEERRVYSVDEEGTHMVHMDFEEELTQAMNQKSQSFLFVISFTNPLQQKVYRVLQEEAGNYSGIGFCVKGNGVIRYRSGTFNDKMHFQPTRLGETEQNMMDVFEQTIKDLPAFRLFAVTGGLQFEEH